MTYSFSFLRSSLTTRINSIHNLYIESLYRFYVVNLYVLRSALDTHEVSV